MNTEQFTRCLSLACQTFCWLAVLYFEIRILILLKNWRKP